MHTKLQFRQRIADPRADQVLTAMQLQTEVVFRRTKIRRVLDTNCPEILRNITLKMPGIRCKVFLGVRRRKDNGRRHTGSSQLARCFDVGLNDHAILHRFFAAPSRSTRLIDAPECPTGNAIVVRHHQGDLPPPIEYRLSPAAMPVEMVDLEISLGPKGHGRIVNALGLGEEFLQSGLRLFFHIRDVARNFQSDLLRHENDQAGTRFGHREQGEPCIDVAYRDRLARDIANHIKHGAGINA